MVNITEKFVDAVKDMITIKKEDRKKLKLIRNDPRYRKMTRDFRDNNARIRRLQVKSGAFKLASYGFYLVTAAKFIGFLGTGTGVVTIALTGILGTIARFKSDDPIDKALVKRLADQNAVIITDITSLEKNGIITAKKNGNPKTIPATNSLYSNKPKK